MTGQGMTETLGFYSVRVIMARRGWYVDGAREILAADAGAVRAIYHADLGTWSIETGNPWSEGSGVLTVTVETGWTVGAVRYLMEQMRHLADVRQR